MLIEDIVDFSFLCQALVNAQCNHRVYNSTSISLSVFKMDSFRSSDQNNAPLDSMDRNKFAE